MPPQDDETVKLRPRQAAPAGRGLSRGLSRRWAVGCAVCAAVAAGAVGWRFMATSPSKPVPPAPIPLPPVAEVPAAPVIPFRTASEAGIAGNHAADIDVFRFDRNPGIVVLDFASLARQGRMLNRVAAMIEKNGLPHDRALDDGELDRAIRAGGDTPETFYYGHDYGTLELGRFFQAADRQSLHLTDDERWLRALLDQARPAPGAAVGLISIPTIGEGGVTADMRATILHHELSHGEYFTNPAYADWTRVFWRDVLDPAGRAAFRGFLVSENYDPGIEDLLANETQAYLMFTPNARFFRPDLVGMDGPAVTRWRARFREGMPQGWLRDQAVREAASL